MKYIRFGEIPPNERSINFFKMSLDDNSDFTWELNTFGADVAFAHVKEKDLEAGVSVFEIDESQNVIAETNELKKDLEVRIKMNEPCYLVEGEYVGDGIDGEPLIKNIKILKRIENATVC